MCFDELPFNVSMLVVIDGGDDVAAFESSLPELDSFFLALKYDVIMVSAIGCIERNGGFIKWMYWPSMEVCSFSI